jgi:hypothetical protein
MFLLQGGDGASEGLCQSTDERNFCGCQSCARPRLGLEQSGWRRRLASTLTPVKDSKIMTQHSKSREAREVLGFMFQTVIVGVELMVMLYIILQVTVPPVHVCACVFLTFLCTV